MKPDERRVLREDAAMGVAVLTFGVIFTVLGTVLMPSWQRPDVWRTSTFEDLIGLSVIFLGLGIVLWWTLSALFALGAGLLFACGKIGSSLVLARLTPAFMRRLVLAVLGLNLAVIPIAQATTGPEGSWTSPEPSASAIDPAWQTTSAGPKQSTPPEPPPNRAPQIAVAAGQNLWRIASENSAPGATVAQIAVEWPKWYLENREAIGPDPNLLRVGTILRAPRAR